MSGTTDLQVPPGEPQASGVDGAGPPGTVQAPGRPRGPRKARLALALAAAAVAAGAGGWLLLGGDGSGDGAATPDAAGTTTTAVERRDLVDREDVEGSLGHAGQRTASAAAKGTVTRLRAEGGTVPRGASLYSLDGEPTAYVMTGRLPAYRKLAAGVDDGADVRQLERNLVALGYDPYGAITVDEHFGSATTAAVKRWQDARDVEQTGSVALGEVVFVDARRVRVGAHRASLGDAVQPGKPVMEVSSTTRVVTAPLAASRQALVRRGDRVEVTLPDGDVLQGRVRSIGRVATPGQEGAEATVDLRVALGGEGARRTGLDQAPVTVSIATESARGVLAVPVTALVATAAGRYSVEVAGRGGTRRLVPVEVGAFAGGYVEIEGSGISEGTRVVIPR
jgi:peptidoglycan hydrolase-like protein with peptidoglycan-binding domain